MSKKEFKTNAMRMLDKLKIPYESLTYECDEFVSGVSTADLTGLPIEGELDLKKAAKAVGEKSVEMLPVKEITNVTGYVRGGCTAIGMKKRFPAVLDASAQGFDQIYVSGGKIGMQLKLRPEDLKRAAGAEYADVLLNGSREAHT